MEYKDFSAFEERIGIKFSNKDILTQAFVHRSYLNEHPSFPIGHNERLEFLGDAVIELAVTEYLYDNYPNPEGELTSWRAALVNANILFEIGREIGLEDYLYLSRGESKDTRSKARQYILANTFEAVVGAMYLDRGLDACRKFIGQFVLNRLPDILKLQLHLDPKSKFQERAQELMGITPSYRVLEERGPDHAKEFTVGVYLGDEFVASGSGMSKQEAQVAAAQKGLEVKEWQ